LTILVVQTARRSVGGNDTVAGDVILRGRLAGLEVPKKIPAFMRMSSYFGLAAEVSARFF
jgi:hypothetical protein